jgi:hypothetical protein
MSPHSAKPTGILGWLHPISFLTRVPELVHSHHYKSVSRVSAGDNRIRAIGDHPRAFSLSQQCRSNPRPFLPFPRSNKRHPWYRDLLWLPKDMEGVAPHWSRRLRPCRTRLRSQTDSVLMYVQAPVAGCWRLGMMVPLVRRVAGVPPPRKQIESLGRFRMKAALLPVGMMCDLSPLHVAAEMATVSVSVAATAAANWSCLVVWPSPPRRQRPFLEMIALLVEHAVRVDTDLAFLPLDSWPAALLDNKRGTDIRC